MTLKFDGWHWKAIGHLSYAKFLCIISKPSVNFRSYSPEQLGSKFAIFQPCNLEMWQMTLKNDRAPLLTYFKLCASFRNHWWIQTGVKVRERLNSVLTSLTFDLWPWPFAWTSLLLLVITHGNFVMIGWLEHIERGVTGRRTGRQTDGRTEPFIELLGRS